MNKFTTTSIHTRNSQGHPSLRDTSKANQLLLKCRPAGRMLGPRVGRKCGGSRRPDPRHDPYITPHAEPDGSDRIGSVGIQILTIRVVSARGGFKPRGQGRVGSGGFYNLTVRVRLADPTRPVNSPNCMYTSLQAVTPPSQVLRPFSPPHYLAGNASAQPLLSDRHDMFEQVNVLSRHLVELSDRVPALVPGQEDPIPYGLSVDPQNVNPYRVRRIQFVSFDSAVFYRDFLLGTHCFKHAPTRLYTVGFSVDCRRNRRVFLGVFHYFYVWRPTTCSASFNIDHS